MRKLLQCQVTNGKCCKIWHKSKLSEQIQLLTFFMTDFQLCLSHHCRVLLKSKCFIVHTPVAFNHCNIHLGAWNCIFHAFNICFVILSCSSHKLMMKQNVNEQSSSWQFVAACIYFRQKALLCLSWTRRNDRTTCRLSLASTQAWFWSSSLLKCASRSRTINTVFNAHLFIYILYLRSSWLSVPQWKRLSCQQGHSKGTKESANWSLIDLWRCEFKRKKNSFGIVGNSNICRM